jgi:hypothetical protein
MEVLYPRCAGLASMLTAADYRLRDGLEYRDLGHHLDHRDRMKTIKRLIRRLYDLGS